MKLSFGVIIAIVLIFIWWAHDHPSQAPAKQGAIEITTMKAA